MASSSPSPTPQQGPGNSLGSSQPTQQPSLDVLLIIFIHGYGVRYIHPPKKLLTAMTHSPSSFKGDDATFRDFPQRLQHILSETVQGTVIEPIVFPAYEVRLPTLFRLHLTQRCSRPRAISYVSATLLRRVITAPAQNKAVERFADWLTTLTVQKEVAHGTGGGAGRAKIVLCGHRSVGSLAQTPLANPLRLRSMGGLLAADSIYEFIHTRPDVNAPLWPNIIACLAFDTPVCKPLFGG
jgi:hypothetical protein